MSPRRRRHTPDAPLPAERIRWQRRRRGHGPLGGVGCRHPPAVVADVRHVQQERPGKDAAHPRLTVEPRTVFAAKHEIRGWSDRYRAAHLRERTGARRRVRGRQWDGECGVSSERGFSIAERPDARDREHLRQIRPLTCEPRLVFPLIRDRIDGEWRRPLPPVHIRWQRQQRTPSPTASHGGGS